MINILGLPRYVETKKTFLFPAYTNMKMGSISLKEILKLYCQSMIESRRLIFQANVLFWFM
jgi:hypothetical protein